VDHTLLDVSLPDCSTWCVTFPLTFGFHSFILLIKTSLIVLIDIQNAVVACLRVLSRLHLKDVLAFSTQTLPILKKDDEMVQFAPFIRAIAYSQFNWDVSMNQPVIQEFLTQVQSAFYSLLI
jgi:hypothetical protein